MSSVYSKWGFKRNPFTTVALQPDAEGERLLVGRDADVAALVRLLEAPPKCVTLEGANGVGKTSLINVAVHRAYSRFVQGEQGDLLIPCSRPFQLDSASSVDEFVDGVYFEVAQTLLQYTEQLKARQLDLPQNHAVSKWLNSPHLTSWQGGVQVLVAGASAGRTSETNTSSGFARSGFRRTIDQWLKAAFPTFTGGGVVCIIDNLELVETSARARALLENLRDTILMVPGLRWVLCGSAGIVRSVASTPRLEGMLHRPIEVSGIDAKHAQAVLSSRISAFSSTSTPGYLPLVPEDFEELYECLRANLRNTLSKSDDYCMWADLQGVAPEVAAEKRARFAEWLEQECTEAGVAAGKGLGQRAWETFDVAVSLNDGSFSPSEFADFGFESSQALRPSVRDLENVGLLVSSQDDTDRRRKTVQVTAKGWLVARWRSGS